MTTDNLTTNGCAEPESAQGKKETPNRKIQRLTLEIIRVFAAQGKNLDFADEDVARELYKTVHLFPDEKDRFAMLARLVHEGAYRYAVEELDTWHEHDQE